jgi:uncharacterized membrane protein
MKQTARFKIFAIGVTLTITSLVFLVGAFLFNPGAPYQDATPEQEAHLQHQIRITEWSCLASAILFPLGVITAVISLWLKPKPTP